MVGSFPQIAPAPSGERVTAVILSAVAQAPALDAGELVAYDDHQLTHLEHETTSRFAPPRPVDVGQMIQFIRRIDSTLVAWFASPRARESFWVQAADTASIAVALAPHDRTANQAEALAAGLLHDVGRLLIEYALPKTYARLCCEADLRHQPLITVERRRLGLDHAQLGGLLAAKWRLSSRVRDAIRLHHDDFNLQDSMTPNDLPRLIQFADALAEIRRPSWLDRRAEQAVRRYSAHFHLTIDDAHTLAREALRASDEAMAAVRADWRQVDSPARRTAPLTRPQVRPTLETPTPDSLAAAINFITRSVDDESLADVCQRIAECVAAFGTPRRNITFMDDATHDCVYCAVCTDGELTLETIFPGLAGGDGGAMISHYAAPAIQRSLIPPPAIASRVIERFRRILRSRSQLMLPIADGRQFLGGVLLDADDTRPPAWQPSPDQIALLSAVFAHAATYAARRNQTQSADRPSAHPEPRANEQTLASIAEMAAGAAHELNSPLAVISGRAQTLARELLDPRQRESLDQIDREARRCSEIIDALLAYAKPDTPQPAMTVLESWLRNLRADRLVEYQHHHTTFDVHLADPSVRIWADATQLTAVFNALISNAFDAMPPNNGRLIINSSSTQSDDSVVLAVRDNGCGMSADVLDRACDPFFSHRPAGRGRGLGLATAKRLTEINGGRLWIESAPDQGTIVYVELPARTT